MRLYNPDDTTKYERLVRSLTGQMERWINRKG